MSLPRYPDYKDSGLPWVGAVPREWDVQPLMGVASERRESNKGLEEDNLLSLSYGRVVQKDMASNDGLLPESFETYQVVHPDDIVFRLTDLQNDKRSLRTAPVSQKGIITSAYLAVVPRLINSRYFAYVLRSYDLTKVFYSMGGGLRQSMKYSDVKRLPILVPSEREQMAIANFLDRETVRIDALIAEQEKLLALLAEKRQATISNAVTRGLGPDVPMKDSGIAWLGEMPAHWHVVPLRWHSLCSSGGAISGSDLEDGPTDLKTIGAFGGNGRMGYTDRSNVREEVLAIGRVGALCGNVHIVPSPAWISDNALVLTASKSFTNDYLAHVLR